MTGKIFRSILSAVIAVLLLSFSVVTGVLYNNFSELGMTELKDELGLAAKAVELEGQNYLEKITNDRYRITWIAADGTVLYDTKAAAGDMENHGSREEVKEALETGTGESSRYSDTLTVKMMYTARLMPDGTVLRIAAGVDSIFVMFYDVLIPMAAILLLAVLLSAFLARRMAKGIVKPLNELDLENPTENDSYEELTPMLGKINKQHKQIAAQVRELKRKTAEFEQVTSSMSEGLVLLDKNGMIVSMNPAARAMFCLEETPIGKDFLTVDRTISMSNAINDALSGKHSQFTEERDGLVYQLGISRIESAGKIVGVIILCFDVTERTYAEKNRQEFTANVSHELKTPLQTIIGSAELLEAGLVKPEDTKRFVGHIRKEAARMVSLVSDIIRLSQLDENREVPKESVDLYDLAAEVAEELRSTADKRGVSLVVTGEHCVLDGVRRYLHEIIYNLCDNGIRYNVEGGKVNVSICSVGDKMPACEKQGEVQVIIKDTGIGIPVEHQSRIFERFYRVDKSHSKETGGTGLGLSIVKHAVAYHGGTINLFSQVGKGTKITITF